MHKTQIKAKEITYYNRLMAQESVNKKNLKLNESNIAKSWRIKFEDGVEAYLDVELYDTYLLCHATWYKGNESFQSSDTRSKLDGEWECKGYPQYSFEVVVG